MARSTDAAMARSGARRSAASRYDTTIARITNTAIANSSRRPKFESLPKTPMAWPMTTTTSPNPMSGRIATPISAAVRRVRKLSRPVAGSSSRAARLGESGSVEDIAPIVDGRCARRWALVADRRGDEAVADAADGLEVDRPVGVEFHLLA